MIRSPHNVFFQQEMISSERDYLREELDIFREQTKNLEKDKIALQQELEESKELDEFKSLEDESKREYEVTCQSLWLEHGLHEC